MLELSSYSCGKFTDKIWTWRKNKVICTDTCNCKTCESFYIPVDYSEGNTITMTQTLSLYRKIYEFLWHLNSVCLQYSQSFISLDMFNTVWISFVCVVILSHGSLTIKQKDIFLFLWNAFLSDDSFATEQLG